MITRAKIISGESELLCRFGTIYSVSLVIRNSSNKRRIGVGPGGPNPRGSKSAVTPALIRVNTVFLKGIFGKNPHSSRVEIKYQLFLKGGMCRRSDLLLLKG